VSSPLLALLVSTSSLSATDLEARATFLEQSLEGPQVHARAWWWGWLSFYSAAVIAQSIRLGLVDGMDESAPAQRADFTISIVKAVGGITSLLLLPLSAMDGAEEMQKVEGDTIEDARRRVMLGEAALAENASESDRRYNWIRHTAMIAVNIAGGLIVWLGYEDLQRGAISTAVGIAVGEIILWTQPWQPRDSFDEYRASFDNVPER
jgi:hypothetical protein